MPNITNYKNFTKTLEKIKNAKDIQKLLIIFNDIKIKNIISHEEYINYVYINYFIIWLYNIDILNKNLIFQNSWFPFINGKNLDIHQLLTKLNEMPDIIKNDKNIIEVCKKYLTWCVYWIYAILINEKDNIINKKDNDVIHRKDTSIYKNSYSFQSTDKIDDKDILNMDVFVNYCLWQHYMKYLESMYKTDLENTMKN